MLLKAFLEILQGWSDFFPQQRTANRAIRQAIGSLICLGRRTLSRIIWTNGDQHKSWSADYFLHSRCKWQMQDIFKPIITRSLSYCRGSLIGVAVDDTRVHKTGTCIRQAFFQRDPMSPRFHVNLTWGVRFLQFSLLLPLHRSHKISARALPIRFEEVSAVKRPNRRRKDYKEEYKKYREASKTHNLSTRAVQAIDQLRKAVDSCGGENKTLVMAGDGSFCNRNLFAYQTGRVELLVRARKDARLCRKSDVSNRFYDDKKFTPEQILDDQSTPWKSVRIFYGGARRHIKYKECGPVYWQTGAKRKPLRLLVLAPTPYRTRKTGKLHYRQPAFLLTTIVEGHSKELLQIYFDRWQIEVNNREEKDTLGVGQAQLHNETAVPKQPALVVAAYSALLLASLIAFGPDRTNAYLPLPKWRHRSTRPSCLDLVTLLRKEADEAPEILKNLNLRFSFEQLTTSAAA